MASKKKTSKTAAAAPAAAQTPPPQTMPQTAPAPAAVRTVTPFPAKWLWVPPALMAAFFLMTCFSAGSTVKAAAMTMVIGAIASCLVRFPVVRDRLSLPLLGVAGWVILNGVSTLYAAAGSFALKEFLKLLIGFSVLLLILAWSRKGENRGRAAASVLAGGTALASLVSIDMLSTRWLSGPLVGFLGLFTGDYIGISANPVEVGVRMNSLYENPNIFAGVAGLGVLLTLGLAVTAEEKKERCFHLEKHA